MTTWLLGSSRSEVYSSFLTNYITLTKGYSFFSSVVDDNATNIPEGTFAKFINLKYL